MFSLLAVGFIGLEYINYIYHHSLLKFIQRRKYYDGSHISPKWMKNYFLNELSKNDLIKWINNTISYNYSIENKYYTPVPINEIPKKRMLKWVSYNLYYKSLWQLDDNELTYSKKILKSIENKLEIKFKKEDNKDIYFLKFGNNQIDCEYRPLVVYGCLKIAKWIAYSIMRSYGFKKYETTNSNIVYFYYKHKKSKSTTIFLHGLGIGIIPYLSFIKKLTQDSSVIVPIIPNISNLEFTGWSKVPDHESLFPSYKSWRNDFKDVMIKHDIKKVNIVGHSFGTIVMGILLNDDWINKRVDKRVFIEPVCFIDECYRIYRYINEPFDWHGGLVTKVFNYLVYNDIYVRYVSQRYLYGPEFWILNYKSMENDKNLIILSDNDQLVPSKSIYNNLSEKNISCVMLEDSYHSDVFLQNKYSGFLGSIHEYLTNSIFINKLICW